MDITKIVVVMSTAIVIFSTIVMTTITTDLISSTIIRYGDIVPNTYCGRGIAVTTGMMVIIFILIFIIILIIIVVIIIMVTLT